MTEIRFIAQRFLCCRDASGFPRKLWIACRVKPETPARMLCDFFDEGKANRLPSIKSPTETAIMIEINVAPLEFHALKRMVQHRDVQRETVFG